MRPAGVSPDQTGTGATPAWRAKAASLLNRVTPAISPSSSAALSSPHPGMASNVGRDQAHAVANALGQFVDRGGEPGDVGQLVAGQLGHQAGRQCPVSGPNRIPRCLAISSDARLRSIRSGSNRSIRHNNRLIVAVRRATRSPRRSTNKAQVRETPHRGRRPENPVPARYARATARASIGSDLPRVRADLRTIAI